MKNLIYLICLLLLPFGVFGQNNFYEKPWKNKDYPILIDAYEKNLLNFDKVITDKRVAVVIHRASIGLRADNAYSKRLKEADQKGILFASYHLGTNEDPIKQADFYLDIIKSVPHQPMALDIEAIGGNNITLKDAEKFISRIYEKTGKYPFVYVNNAVFQEISKNYDKSSLFAKCPLWYARFKDKIPTLSKKVWDKVTLWQFSCEINCEKTGECLYNVPGTLYDMDINAFNGTKEELLAFFEQNINAFVKANFKMPRTDIKLVGKDYPCGYKEVYFVQGFTVDGKLKERYLVYNRNGNFIKSNDFIKWCVDQLDNPEVENINKETDALNILKIEYKEGGNFRVEYEVQIPENIPDSGNNIGIYVVFTDSNDNKSYGFPTKKECE